MILIQNGIYLIWVFVCSSNHGLVGFSLPCLNFFSDHHMNYVVRKHFMEVKKKFRNVILFVDYIKFNPQTFDYINFVLNIYFSISSLKI
jgi:hypothetical protein